VESLERWAIKRLDELARFHKRPGCNVLSAVAAGELPSTNSLVQLFLFQKDEEELLADWLQYHAYLFGIENLHVIDHQSTNKNICRLLALYRICGVQVVTHMEGFEKKFRTLTKVMKGHYDKFLVPMDTDEFIVRASGNGTIEQISIQRESIVDVYRNLTIDGRKYKFGHWVGIQYDSATCEGALSMKEPKEPLRRITRLGYLGGQLINMTHTKTFFHSHGFMQTDQGNHFGLVEHDAVVKKAVIARGATSSNLTEKFSVVDELALLHADVSCYRSLRAKYLRGAASYGYTDATDCTSSMIGQHYCQGAKEFRKESKSSKTMFYYHCLAQNFDTNNAVLVEWFNSHTLSLKQLLGVLE
jgi:hypothetical protein